VLRRFRAEMPMTRWMRPLLDEVLGPGQRPEIEPLRHVA
jgi:hypothetical protein